MFHSTVHIIDIMLHKECYVFGTDTKMSVAVNYITVWSDRISTCVFLDSGMSVLTWFDI